MKFSKSILLLASLLLCSCAENKQDSSSIDTSKAPDYSASSKKMTMYAYAAPGKGTYSIDGTTYQIVDENGNEVTFQTKEMYQQYKDCGFDYLLIDANDQYRGEEWFTSHVKSLFDLADSVGLKTILFDNRIYALSLSKDPLVGEGCKYATQEDLVNDIKEFVKDYSAHPAFYGLLILDEPTYASLPAIGSLYHAIKTVNPDIFIQCNLFPLASGQADKYENNATDNNLLSAYRHYVTAFVEATNADYIMYDSYPMTVSKGDINSPSIKIEHLVNFQIIAEIAEEKNLELYMVIQSSSWSNNGVRRTRPVSLNDLFWQWNTALAFGVDQISYFTYMRRRSNASNGEYFDDGTSFVTSNGKTTPLYDWAKAYHPGIKSLAAVTMNFSYKGLISYVNSTTCACNANFLSGVIDSSSFSYIDLDESKNDAKSILLATEMVDKSNDQYGYMLINITDPATTIEKSSSQIVFKDDVDAIRVIDDEGNVSDYSVSSHTYDIALEPGRGLFVMPYSY